MLVRVIDSPWDMPDMHTRQCNWAVKLQINRKTLHVSAVEQVAHKVLSRFRSGIFPLTPEATSFDVEGFFRPQGVPAWKNTARKSTDPYSMHGDSIRLLPGLG